MNEGGKGVESRGVNEAGRLVRSRLRRIGE